MVKHVNTAGPFRDDHADIAIIGGGPGGYSAAFRLADLGIKTVLIESGQKLGGVCLNEGCISSSVMLQVSKIIRDSMNARKFGIHFGPLRIDFDELRQWKNNVITQLGDRLLKLSNSRKVNVVQGTASFQSPHEIIVRNQASETVISFDQAIVAAGSSPACIPYFPDDSRIITSKEALELKQIPNRMLIIGGSVVGLELAAIYASFGSEVTIAETRERLIPFVDMDLVKPLHNVIQNRYKRIYLNTKVIALKSGEKGITATLDRQSRVEQHEYDLVLLAIGRKPNSGPLLVKNAGIKTAQNGNIIVDRQQRTSARHIFAVGDIVGEPMLAHKASHEGKIAAEVIAGVNAKTETVVVPFVAYTDPEIAWAGITEEEARNKGINFETSIFPWAINGRSVAVGRHEGLTKIIFDKKSNQVLGTGIVGSNASELISQMVLSIETGCKSKDLSLTVHPHPTHSESLTQAAAMFEGTITDLYMPKQRRKHRGQS